MAVRAEQEDSIYDIIMKCAEEFSESNIRSIDQIMIETQTNYGPDDPGEISVFCYLNKGRITSYRARYNYSENSTLPRNAYPKLVQSINAGRFELEAKPHTENCTEIERLMMNKQSIIIEAPIWLGLASVSLPEEYDWISTALLTSQLDRLGLRYRQDEHLTIKALKRRTKIENIYLAYDNFVKNGFDTELTIGRLGRPNVSVRSARGEFNDCSIYCSGLLLGIGRKKIEKMSRLFEEELKFTLQGRSFEVNKLFSSHKRRKMRIDYQ